MLYPKGILTADKSAAAQADFTLRKKVFIVFVIDLTIPPTPRLVMQTHLECCEDDFLNGAKVAFPQHLSLLAQCKDAFSRNRAHNVGYLDRRERERGRDNKLVDMVGKRCVCVISAATMAAAAAVQPVTAQSINYPLQ